MPNANIAKRPFNVFIKCIEESASPNSITIGCDLKACGFSSIVAQGQQIHSELMIESIDIEPLAGKNLVSI